MADPKKKDAEAAPPPPSKGPLILALVNTLAALSVAGLLVYTKIIYKRPHITETGERARLRKTLQTPQSTESPGLVDFVPVSVNIAPTPGQPLPADGTPEQLQGKLHYVTLGFSLEVRDIAQKDKIDSLRSVLMDSILGILGRKDFQELATVQGRYLLRTQIIDTANELVRRSTGYEPRPGEESKAADAFVTAVYFTQFVVQ